jgi:hypothetical protein
MVQAESNTATGLTVVPKVTVHQVKWALQRKLRHLEVPTAITTGLVKRVERVLRCAPSSARLRPSAARTAGGLDGPASRRQSGAMPLSTVATTPSASAPKAFSRSSPRPPT